MSTTVYGKACADGSIKFYDLEECLVQSACVVREGVHAGQVALTLSDADNEDCNNTFYGCIDPATSKFQVVIPDDCCALVGACIIFGEDACDTGYCSITTEEDCGGVWLGPDTSCPEQDDCCYIVRSYYTVQVRVPEAPMSDWVTVYSTGGCIFTEGVWGTYLEFCYQDDPHKVRLNRGSGSTGCTYIGSSCPFSGSCINPPYNLLIEFRVI